MALADVVSLLSSSLQAANPNLDLRSGTPLNDLILTSTSVAYNYIDQEIKHDRIVGALANWQQMTLKELQLLSSNFFINYPSGTYSTGSVRVYYSSPIDFIASPLSTFYSSAGNSYVPQQPVEVTSQQMSLQFDGTLYYADVTVMATSTGSSFNITSSGQIVRADNIPSYIRVTNLQAFSTATNAITMAQFYSMIQNSLTTRDFVSATSIYSMLTQSFPVINNLNVVGYGDSEMTRDLIRYSTSGTMHAGSSVDVYIDMNGNNRIGNTLTYVGGPGIPSGILPFVQDWGASGITVTYQINYAPIFNTTYSGTSLTSSLYCPAVVFGTLGNLVNSYLLDASTYHNLIISDQMRLPIMATFVSGNAQTTSDGNMDYGSGTYGGGWYGTSDAWDFLLSTVSGTEFSDRASIIMVFNPVKYFAGAFNVLFQYEEKSQLSSIDALVLSGLRNTVTDVQPKQTYPLSVDIITSINEFDPLLLISGLWSSYVQNIVSSTYAYIRKSSVKSGLYIGDIIDIVHNYNPQLRVITPFTTFNVTLYHPTNFKEKFVVNGSFTSISSSFNPVITNRICSFYPGTVQFNQGVIT